MSALAVEPGPDNGSTWDRLVHFWQELDWPEGCKVEIIEGIVTMAPTPASSHNYIAHLVHRDLYRVIPEDWAVCQTQSVAMPPNLNMFIPDLLVVPSAALKKPGCHIPAEAAELVVEITPPSNAQQDRIQKLRGYASAGVPLYLLLDSWASNCPSATLYGEPKNGMYRVLEVAQYGEGIHLPEPFGLTIDTGAFPVPPLR
ncbi:Uma2 family endonuclease [Streptomyces sp. MUM 203J]|uniref:Uma2 family endonuclease n=1 Tax=Streptomyces sp. MUM 203J TaxID=2791990 RepID=UPI001F050137|nr:Uma2 family endonuclease [Streptomyces sp. MUM 203J]MCH0539391.1 Uma2 family endonuclease [Streptomyces sp. MUM 203J]